MCLETTMRSPGGKRRFAIAAVAAMGLVATACGDDGASGPSIDAAWARTSPMNVDAGAAYFTISSDEAITIVGVSVDSSIAATAELHETTMADMEGDGDMAEDDMADMAEDDMGDMADMGGAMMMQEVESIPVAAGSSVAFEPGGLHVMLLELAEPLELGHTFAVTISLDDGSEIDVDVEVRDEAP